MAMASRQGNAHQETIRWEIFTFIVSTEISVSDVVLSLQMKKHT